MLDFVKRTVTIWACMLVAMFAMWFVFESISMLATLAADTWGRWYGLAAWGLVVTGAASVLTAATAGVKGDIGPV